MREIDCKPFPELQLNELYLNSWEGTDIFPEWSGFSYRGGSPFDQASNDSYVSQGEVRINVATEVNQEPGEAQRNAYEYIKNNMLSIQSIILDSFLAKYNDLREDMMADYDLEESDDFVKDNLPRISKIEDLKRVLRLDFIHLHKIERNNLAYIGFQFSVNWEEEHGAGILMHKDRIVAFGHSDTSFLEWVAEEDLEKV